ncbi:MAG: RNA 2',3'-cyclic phosphodiesterase [Gammaproteobacteria bacterium]|nr:RNA 2',3'-cyclic phosphodiesterase [Gammaproteobacteria bacterium]
MTHKKRLFFAVWPTDEVRAALVEGTQILHESGDGRVVDPANLHLTLAFLHNVETALLPCICDAAQRACTNRFSITLERIGWWRRAGILWVGPAGTHAILRELVGRLWQELGDCGFTPERRRFTPHVTLARKVTRAPRVQTLVPIHWPVSSIVLVESVTGRSRSTYNVIDSWPLRGL